MSEVKQISEEPNEQETAPETVSFEDRAIEAAKEQGWREDGELDALEFLKRGSEFHKDLKRTVDELKRQNETLYKVVAEDITSNKQREHQATVGSLKEQIREAAEAGDSARVLALTEQMQGLKAPEPVTLPNDPNTEIMDAWVQKNPWFQANKEMNADALGFYLSEKERLGVDDPAQILPKVEARIKKEYSDYFTPKNPNRERAAGEPGNGRTPKQTRTHKGLSRDDLDEDEKRHFDQFLANGLDEKALLKAVEEQRASRGR